MEKEAKRNKKRDEMRREEKIREPVGETQLHQKPRNFNLCLVKHQQRRLMETKETKTNRQKDTNTNQKETCNRQKKQKQ